MLMPFPRIFLEYPLPFVADDVLRQNIIINYRY